MFDLVSVDKHNIFKFGSIAIFLLCFFAAFFYSQRSHAAKASINDIKIDKRNSHLTVSFRVEGCFTPEMEKAIKKGAQTSFTFLIQLKKIRSFWLDKNIKSLKIQHKVKYDNLKKVFLITLDERDDNPIEVSSLEDAKKLMASVEKLELIPIDELDRGEKYTLRVKAEFERVRLPLRLEYVFIFVRLLDFTTSWYQLDFSI